MNIYDIVMKPLEAGLLGKIRSEIVPLAHGHVLETAMGTGANLPYYNPEKIISFTGSDKEISMEGEARGKNLFHDSFHMIPADMEALPLPNGHFDSVVSTLVLCTANIHKSLAEIQRVLKPGGLFIFIEHIKPKGNLGILADTVNKFWPKLAQGCNLNRHTDEIIKSSGFTNLNIHYKGAGIFCYGLAVKA